MNSYIFEPCTCDKLPNGLTIQKTPGVRIYENISINLDSGKKGKYLHFVTKEEVEDWLSELNHE